MQHLVAERPMSEAECSEGSEGGKEREADKVQTVVVSISVDDSPPHGSSLLLCPAQWSALLEAAPVSLVVREMREGVGVMEEEEEEGEGEVGGNEGGLVPRLVFAEDDEIRTPLGGQSPDTDCTSDHSALSGDKEAGIGGHMATERSEDVALDIGEGSVPSSPLSPPPPGVGTFSVDLPSDVHPLPSSHLHTSPVTPSQSAIHLEHTTEERLPGQPATPPDHRHQVAWRDNTSPLSRHSLTLPSSPTHPYSKSPELDIRRWPPYKTHCRNISETPSLPPFHSSSTSSAYHSRNSSLGSQLSSCCFESDSMLSQLTDVDSCLAVRTGSHSDLKQPLRFHRRGDTSPCCSDLSLPTHLSPHLPSPLLQNRLKGLSLSPSLEETLCNCSSREYVIESLEEKQRAMGLKSSEWIKQQMEKSRESIVQVKVSSKSKHVVHYNVKSGDMIIWEFATKKRDIGFGVLFEATEVATEQDPLPSSHESLEKKVCSILPLFRVSTHAHPAIGYHCATQDGVYEIYFDNTYSRFFAKELFYRITTQSSEPNINYLQQ